VGSKRGDDPLDRGDPARDRVQQTFRFGTVDRTRSQNVVVRIVTEDGVVGYGEACPVRAFTAETQQIVVALIDERVREVVVGQDPTLVRPILRALAPRLVHCPFTLAAVDIALWDLAGKLLGVPVSTLLGGRLHDRIEVHGSVGWDRPEAMAEAALAQLAAGYRTLKLYAGRDDLDADLDRLAAVRAAIGPDPRLIVDVNGLWSVSQCLWALPRLEGLGVVLLEQPVAAWDGPGQAEVVRASRIDVCADEAVYGPEDVARIGRERTARTINLGLSKLGGWPGRGSARSSPARSGSASPSAACWSSASPPRRGSTWRRRWPRPPTRPTSSGRSSTRPTSSRPRLP
jgi:muconate cycloisomerase